MTKNKKQKKLIRERAAKTGVRYTTARRYMGVLVKPASKSGPAMRAALDFPLDHILARYMTDEGVDRQEALVHLSELRRYSYIASQHRGSWPMVPSLDPLWHTFLLFTKDYQRFCEALGVPFIHHQPFGEVVDYDEVHRNYEKFLTVYRSAFGEPRDDIWPESLDNSNCVDCDRQCQGQCVGSDD